MTPAATHAATHGATIPRRVSGPTRRRRVQHAEPALLGRFGELADSRLLERLTRGRGWIALIGVMLLGLVFVQVSMLRLNTGIGHDVATAGKLERANQQLRNTVADLAATDRVAAAAQREGMVMPAAGAVHYLDAGKSSADAAARGISAPAPVQQQPLTTTTSTAAAVGTTATPVTAAGVTPVVQPQTTVTPQQTTVTPQQQDPVTAQQPDPTALAASNGGVAAAP